MGLPLCLNRGWAVWGGEGRQGWKGKEGQPGQGRPRGVSTPCGNRREQKSHRKPRSASEPGRAVPPARCIPWGPCCVPTPRPPPGSTKWARHREWGPTCPGSSRWGALAPFPADPCWWSPFLVRGRGLLWGSVPPSWGRRCSLQAPAPSWTSLLLGCPRAEPLPPPALLSQRLRTGLCRRLGFQESWGHSLGLCRASCPWGSLSPGSSGCPWLCPGSSPPCPGSAWAWCPCGCTCPRSGRRGRGSWAWC